MTDMVIYYLVGAGVVAWGLIAYFYTEFGKAKEISGMALGFFFEHKDMECFNGKAGHDPSEPVDNLCVPCWSRVVLESLAIVYGRETLEKIVKKYRRERTG